jgi:hypothetical protein
MNLVHAINIVYTAINIPYILIQKDPHARYFDANWMVPQFYKKEDEETYSYAPKSTLCTPRVNQLTREDATSLQLLTPMTKAPEHTSSSKPPKPKPSKPIYNISSKCNLPSFDHKKLSSPIQLVGFILLIYNVILYMT